MIASGLARGIDTAAHLAALELGTIAVLAAGIDNVYPPENEELHRAIAEPGLLISERAPSFSPRGKDFPPAPKPPHLRDLAWRGGGRGRRALRITDHGAVRRGARPRGVCRAGQPARSAGGRNQHSPEAGRMPRDKRARHRRDLGPDPGPACPASRRRARRLRSRANARSSPRYSCQRALAGPGER